MIDTAVWATVSTADRTANYGYTDPADAGKSAVYQVACLALGAGRVAASMAVAISAIATYY